jgi:hypothetical protein
MTWAAQFIRGKSRIGQESWIAKSYQNLLVFPGKKAMSTVSSSSLTRRAKRVAWTAAWSLSMTRTNFSRDLLP